MSPIRDSRTRRTHTGKEDQVANTRHDQVGRNQGGSPRGPQAKMRARERLEIAIPISEIEHAPAGRLMDLSQIAGLILFRDRGTMAGSFEVERILLRR